MKKILCVIIFVATLAPIAFSQENELSVEATLKKTVLIINHDVFLSVRTGIVNATDKEQAICMWSCCYEDSWITDNPLMEVCRMVCVENHRYYKLLKPGEKFEKDIELRLSDQAKPGDIAFRLGFKSCDDESDGKKTENKIYWSNLSTIRVK